MIPASFDYRAPSTLEEALSLLAQHRGEAKVLAGGHSLIPAMKLRLLSPRLVVDLGKIPGLDAIRPRGGGIAIGARVTHAAVMASELVARSCPLLAQVAAEIGDVQVRNAGTLVGSLCHADPAADWPAGLLALEAQAVVVGPRGERTVPVDAFLAGLFTTRLEPDELVREVLIPRPASSSCAYRKIAQSASGFAIAAAAVQVSLDGGRVREAAVAVTGIADRAYRARAVEEALAAKAITAETAAAAAELAVPSGLDLLSDIHASAEYRGHLARVCVRRALLEAAGLRS